jgi:superfamily II DNA or RNA helicase
MDLASRSRQKRIRLPNLFSSTVVVEDVVIHDGTALLRVKRSDGGLEEVTLDESDLERALAQSGAQEGDLASGVDLRYKLEAVRIRLAYAFDPYFAVSLSGVRALPHQLEAVYERLLPQPRLRFILAHDPGAGKTIMAGLLIKELKLRGAIERVLVLVPSPLTPQWQDELAEKFQETFEIIDSHIEMGQLAGNIWQRFPQVIASMDYAKRDIGDNPAAPTRSVHDAVLQCSWDLVIVDEAHKASANQYGAEIKPTKRYRLVEDLSKSPRVNHMLFLTATPHQGKEDQFRLFLRLLDPDQFSGLDMEDIHRLLGEDPCPFFQRRVKDDLRDFNGRKLFLPRNAYTQDFELSGPESDLYRDVTRYIQNFLGKTYTGRRRMAVALARSVLQRRLASSLHAITESLRRRSERLQGSLDELEKLPVDARERRLRELGVIVEVDDETDYDDTDDEDRDRASTEVMVADSIDALRREVAEVRRLHGKATGLRDASPSVEAKLRRLKDCLDRAEFRELAEGGGKLLIFTEHRDTLEHLERSLRSWGYSVVTIHGGHNAVDRKERRRRFDQEEQICVATDAAGEGVNLQFCHLMINYDVPWNPNRLEQRMGRIHRIGQDREVHVFNFIAVNTEEGRVLHRLLEKINQIKKDLQTDRIFDVIGTFLRVENLNPEEVLREAAINPRRADDFLDKVEQLTADEVRKFEAATAVALARRNLDLAALNRRTQLHEDLRLMPEYVQDLFLVAARMTGLEVDERADGLLRVPSVPQRFRSPILRAVERYGSARDRYLKATFRKEQRVGKNSDAELLSPGHPLYVAAIELFEQRITAADGATAVFRDPRAEKPYYLHVFEVHVVGEASGFEAKDIKRLSVDARFVPVVETLDGTFDVAAQDVLHELDPLSQDDVKEIEASAFDKALDFRPVDPERVRAAGSWVKLHVQHVMTKTQQVGRAEDVRIRREYLDRAFETQLIRLHQDELAVVGRLESGEQGAAGRLAQIRDQMQQTELRQTDRTRALERLAVARGGDVRHLASIIVLPLPIDSEVHRLMKADPVVERIAMELVLAHEVERGWEAEDVSRLKDGRGYDILSHGDYDTAGLRPVRRIEVKGRSVGSGDVALSRNEWIKAARLKKDYWLYVVYDARAGALPRLVKIQDPANALAAVSQELTVIKGYRLPGAAIASAATEV